VRDLALRLVRELVHEPGRVQVRERRDGQSVLLEIGVDTDDRGRVIGRGGRTVDALRTVLDAVARWQGRSCRVEILDR
jgi:predicted RNA-binding protein YlqC (UPF0109 family)